MKGQKAYTLAQEVHHKMYGQYERLTTDKQLSLYHLYLNFLKNASYKGHTEALFDLGQQYEDCGYLGLPNPMYNPRKCIYWYTKAVNKGHPDACNNLATFYEKGEGCMQDLSRALSLYKLAADRDYWLGKKSYKKMQRDMAEGGRYHK
jgi:TPR repeat protein